MAVRTVVAGGSSSVQYLHPDHLGSIGQITDQAQGWVQDLYFKPYGGVRWAQSGVLGPDSDSATRRSYTGQYEEKSDWMGSLMHYKARYYSPFLHRFTQPDTIVPGAGNPQNLNRFMYANGNPVNLSDPTGHVSRCMSRDGVGYGSRCDSGSQPSQQRQSYSLYIPTTGTSVPAVAPIEPSLVFEYQPRHTLDAGAGEAWELLTIVGRSFRENPRRLYLPTPAYHPPVYFNTGQMRRFGNAVGQVDSILPFMDVVGYGLAVLPEWFGDITKGSSHQLTLGHWVLNTDEYIKSSVAGYGTQAMTTPVTSPVIGAALGAGAAYVYSQRYQAEVVAQGRDEMALAIGQEWAPPGYNCPAGYCFYR